MRGGADGAARRRRVSEQLGEAVWAALELMVGAYGAQTEETVDAETVNGSFDTARFLALRGEETVRETEVSRAEEAEAAHGRVLESGAAVAEAAKTRGEQARAVRQMRTEGGAPFGTVRGAAWRERVVEKEAAAPVRGGEFGRSAVRSGAETTDALRTAARVSEEIERDARRYDGALTLA